MESMTLASQIQKEYRDGINYKNRMGYLKKWAEYEKFKAGEQWPPATEKTRNLPRPVFNIIDLIESHKVSTVMNENIKMVFSSDEGKVNTDLASSADIFTRYADTIWEITKQDDLNEEALEIAANAGTAIIHYYWDAAVNGGSTVAWQGQLQGEVIDPANFFPGNPQQRKVQKMPYIIISSRELVANVQEEARRSRLSEEQIKLIVPDRDTEEEAYQYGKIELEDSDKVTILTKYYRKKDDYIYFAKVAGNVVIKPETNTNRKLYPIAAMQWKRRRKAFFGISETEGLIPNQKGINFLMAMQLLSVQLTGWPKLVFKSGALPPGFTPTNTPGEIIEDKGNMPGENIRYMNPGPISPVAQMLTEKFIEYTKEVNGAHEAAMGETPGGELNATAIMLLQKASGVPIESIRRRFYSLVEDIGRIWEEFFKINYRPTRLVNLKDDNGEEYSTFFNGEEHSEVEMHLKIDIGPASTYSETLMMSSLDRFLEKQYISFEQYLKYAPKNVVPFKDRLLKEIQEQEQMAATQQAMMPQMPEMPGAEQMFQPPMEQPPMPLSGFP